MHDNFPNVLKARLTWSKNVQEERDAPWQIVLGSLDSVFCVYLSLSLWLELNLKTNPNSFESPYVFSFSNDVGIPTGGVKAKDAVQNVFGQKVFNREEFVDDEGPLGSHSIRKFGATHVRRCGCSKDEKDIRGRWKGKGRVSDVYDDVELPYPDAKVAEKLCFGGACIYKNCDEDDAFKNSVINSFLLTIVVPNIRKKLPELVSLVLGRLFLWCVYSEFHYMVPEDVKNEIKKGLGEVRTWETNSEKNPIIQQQVLVTGNQGSVFLDEILDSVDQANDLEENGVGNNREIRRGFSVAEQLMVIQSSLMSLRREVIQMKAEQDEEKVVNGILLSRNFSVVNSNLRRLATQVARPVRVAQQQQQGVQRGGDSGEVVGSELPGNLLSPYPRSLHDLWEEYQNGLGDRKPARLLTYNERGRVKHKFHRRKVVWDLISGLVRQGLTANAAIDRIYSVYGAQTSVTKIINAVKFDKKHRRLNANLSC
jgi:hypothetical protein